MQTAVYPNGTTISYGYDNAGRVNSIQHTKTSTGTLIVGYAAQYDPGGRITQITETPSGDVTVFNYDNANNLLSETRTGTKPYSGVYSYDQSNRRLTAVVVTNGVTTHNGAYSYNGAGWLTQVIDSATGITEEYTWNNDGTLASAPGSGYTKLFFYNEESQLVRIQHNTGGVITTAYDYAYGADGNRRWRKDYVNNIWTWYPCGVACQAGELVEETSDLTGGTWTTSALYLRAGGGCSSTLIRRNSEYHHTDILGNFGVITGSTATVLSNNLYDKIGALRFTSGSAQTPYRSAAGYTEVDDLVAYCFFIIERELPLAQLCRMMKLKCVGPFERPCTGRNLADCQFGCGKAGVAICCENFHPSAPGLPSHIVLCICKSIVEPKPVQPGQLPPGFALPIRMV